MKDLKAAAGSIWDEIDLEDPRHVAAVAKMCVEQIRSASAHLLRVERAGRLGAQGADEQGTVLSTQIEAGLKRTENRLSELANLAWIEWDQGRSAGAARARHSAYLKGIQQ